MDELFRTPDERFATLPGYGFEPHWHDAGGLRMHYVDEGAGEPVVCFHGEPTWAYLYRKMLPPLTSAGMRVICPDYAGFGRSDKPTDRPLVQLRPPRRVHGRPARGASTCTMSRSSSRTGAGRSGCAGRSRTPSASRGS